MTRTKSLFNLIICYQFCSIFSGYAQKIAFPEGFTNRWLTVKESNSSWNWCFGESSDSLITRDGNWSSFIIKQDGSTTTLKSLWGEEFKGLVSPVSGEFKDFRYFILNKTRLYRVNKALRVEFIPTPQIDVLLDYTFRDRYIFNGYLFFNNESGAHLIHLDSMDGKPRNFDIPEARFIAIGDSMYFGLMGAKFDFFDPFFRRKKVSAELPIPINWKDKERLVFEPDSLQRPFSYQKLDSNGVWERMAQGRFISSNNGSFNFQYSGSALVLEIVDGKLVSRSGYRADRSGSLEYGFQEKYPSYSYGGYYINEFYSFNHKTDVKVNWPLPGSAVLKSAEKVWCLEGMVFASISAEQEGREQLFRFRHTIGKWEQVTQFDFERYAYIDEVNLLGSKLLIHARAIGNLVTNVFLIDSNSVVAPRPTKIWSRILSPPVFIGNGISPSILMGMDVSTQGEIVTLNQVSNFSDLFWQGTGLDSFRIKKSTIAPAPNYSEGGQIITLFDKNKQIKWTRTISGFYLNRRSGIKFSPQGKIALVGYNFPFVAIDSIRINSTWSNISYVAQFDSGGKTEWVVPIISNQRTEATELTIDGDGNIFFVVMAEGPASIGDVFIFSRISRPAFFLVKVSRLGKALWAKELNIRSGFSRVQSARINFNPKFNQVNLVVQEICNGCFGYEFDSTTQCRLFGYDAATGNKQWERTLATFEAGLVVNGFKVSEKGALHIVGAGAGTLTLDNRPILQFEKPNLAIQPFWLRLNPYGGTNEINALALPSLYPWDLDIDENEAVVIIGNTVEANNGFKKYLYVNQEGLVLEELKFPEPNKNDNPLFECNPQIFISQNKEVVIGDYFDRGYSGVPYRFGSYFNKSILFGFPFETKSQAYSFSKAAESFLIFPNPSSGPARLFLNYFKFEKLNVSLFTLEGKLVFSGDLNFREEEFYELPINHLPSGMYFVKINSSKPFSTLKWIRN